MALFKRELRVVVRAQDAYSAELKKAGASFDKFGNRTQTSIRKTNRGLLSMQNLMLGFIAITAGKTFINNIATLEKGWIGVAKTTGMAGAELESLQESIRLLSVEMKGVAIEDFQSIAQTAGQLGIRGVENIREFTRVIAMMTVATDLTADQAAKDFAQIANVMSVPIDQLETMGSVMNELSNTSVATASDISNLTLRMGGAAENLGLTSAEVMALSASLRDVGVDLQVGGTAMSQVFQKMLTDTAAFAKAAGIPLKEFRRLIEDEPIAAVKLLIENMAKMGKIKAAEALKGLGLEGVRVGGVLLKLKGDLDGLNDNLNTANEELKRGTSLSIEYETAAEGLAAKATAAKNALKILGEEIAVGLLPGMKDLLDLSIKLADNFAKMGRGLGIIAGEIAIGKVRTEIELVTEALEEAQKTTKGGTWWSRSEVKVDEKLVAELQAKLKRLHNEERLELVRSAKLRAEFNKGRRLHIIDISGEEEKAAAAREVFFRDEVAIARARKALQRDPGVLEAGPELEITAEVARMDQRLIKIAEFHDRKINLLILEGKFGKDLHAAVEAANTQITEQENAKRVAIAMSAAGALASIGSNLNKILGGQSKVALRIHQGLAIREAVIEGKVAAIAAWKQGQKLGGPPLAVLFAAASLAATGAMIADIGGAGAGGGSPTASVPATTVPTVAPIDTEPIQRQDITININNPVGTTEEQWAKIVEDNIVPALSDGVQQGTLTINLANA